MSLGEEGRKEKAEEQRKKTESENRKLRGAIDGVLRTENGKLLFKHLFYICGYNKLPIVQHPTTGLLLTDNMVYNVGRRGIYVQLRELATYDLLKVAEELAENPQENERK